MFISLAEQLPKYAIYADPPPCYDPEKALKDFNALNPEQKGEFANGIALAVSSSETDQAFKKASTDAATSVQEIETLFIVLTAKLISLGNTENFVGTFKIIQKNFRDVVKDSHALAVTISQYADSFDEIIVKFCADDRPTVEQRISKIKQFIEKSKSIETAAGAMGDRFTELKNDFTDFVGTFSTWAKAQEEKDEKKIKELYDTIADLDKQLAAISTAINAVAGALPITGILAALFPPAAPIIIGIGLTIAGVELASLVGLLIAQNILLDEKRTAENQIKDLQDEISKIKAARTQLEKDGQVALVSFTDNISVIQNVWSLVVNDATDIQLWLEQGANDADCPEYMKLSLDKGVKVYSRMGQYLKDYADGVTEMVKTFKN